MAILRCYPALWLWLPLVYTRLILPAPLDPLCSFPDPLWSCLARLWSSPLPTALLPAGPAIFL